MVNGEKETWIALYPKNNKPSVIIAISNRGRLMRKSGKIEVMAYRQRITVKNIRMRAYRYLAEKFIRKTEEDKLKNRWHIDHITHTPRDMYINDIRNMRWCTKLENDRFEERCKNLSDKAKGFVALSIEEHYGKPISEIRHQYEYDRWFYHHHNGKFPWE